MIATTAAPNPTGWTQWAQTLIEQNPAPVMWIGISIVVAWAVIGVLAFAAGQLDAKPGNAPLLKFLDMSTKLIPAALGGAWMSALINTTPSERKSP